MKNYEWSKSQGVILCRNNLQITKERILESDYSAQRTWKFVQKKADRFLNQEALSVTHKKILPPSGDVHDYISVGTYWWPNPDKKDGLPYVRRDGEINPEFKGSDVDRFFSLSAAVLHLSVASFLTDNLKYANKAAELLKVWFLDPSTMMNPHLSYAQHIPGINEGRSLGIIDLKSIRQIIDGVVLLPKEVWDSESEKSLVNWMKKYLGWLLQSKFGNSECAQKNNHGTWFDAQTLSVALYVGDMPTALQIAERGKNRIAQQISSDGKQELELARSRPITYSMMNLQGLFDIASMAQKIDVDLWSYETNDGRSLERAFRWLVDYVIDEKVHQKQDIIKPKPAAYISIFHRGINQYEITDKSQLYKLSLSSENIDSLIFPLIRIDKKCVHHSSAADSNLQKVSSHWDKVKSRQGTKWWENKAILQRINTKVSGLKSNFISAGALELLKKKLGGRLVHRAVSVGCGTGRKEMALIECGLVEHFTLYELSAERVDQGRANARKKGIDVQVNFIVGDAFADPVESEYDLVHWNNSLHHMFDVFKAVKWSHDVLKIGGIFFMDDFIGPARFQWGDQTLLLGTRIRAALPERYRLHVDGSKLLPVKPVRPDAARLISIDPSEAVESDKIIDVLNMVFSDIELKYTGGAVYNVILNNMLQNFDISNESDLAIIDLLMIIDDLCASHPDYENHYAVAIAQR